jgi:hypothetical protein
MVAPTSQYAKQTNLLRFRESPHIVFRLSLASLPFRKAASGHQKLQISLIGLA